MHKMGFIFRLKYKLIFFRDDGIRFSTLGKLYMIKIKTLITDVILGKNSPQFIMPPGPDTWVEYLFPVLFLPT